MIWKRYIVKETLKVFFLFLACFFFLYAMIDYSLHMQDFVSDKRIHFSHILAYYSFQFIKRADLLVPLALLVATMKVLFAMNQKGELIALQSSGLARKKIARPFFILALFCALFNLLSSEFFLPSSLNQLDHFRQKHFRHSRSGNRKTPIHVLPLKDRSKIIYQIEDKEKKLYLDVFWVRSANEIWRMHSMTNDPENPVGYFVDHMKRDQQGNFEKVKSFETYRFDQFRWQVNVNHKGYSPIENRSLRELMRLLLRKDKTPAYEYSQALTYFLFKLTMPFLSLLAVTAVLPFCIRHSRNLPIFLSYAIALFSFVAFFALMDAAVILGENLIYSPYLAILLPFGVCAAFFGFNFVRKIS